MEQDDHGDSQDGQNSCHEAGKGGHLIVNAVG